MHPGSGWFGIGSGSLNSPSMSALGQKRTLRLASPMSALPPKADIAAVMSALCQKQTLAHLFDYLVDDGTVRPSALAGSFDCFAYLHH
jgi:hypothetical protein